MPSIFDKINPFHKIAKVLVPDTDPKTLTDQAALRAAMQVKDGDEITDEQMDEKIIRSRRRGDIKLPKK